MLLRLSLLFSLTILAHTTPQSTAKSRDKPRRRFVGLLIGKGLKALRYAAVSTAQASGRVSLALRTRISVFRAKRRYYRDKKKADELDRDNIHGSPPTLKPPRNNWWWWLCCCCGCVCCKGGSSCLPGAGPGFGAAFDCILPRSLWVPNTPSIAALLMEDISDDVNSTSLSSSSSNIPVTSSAATKKTGFMGRWTKTTEVNQNWALELLGYTKVQRAIIERVRLPLDIQLSNASFVVRTCGIRTFHTSYPLDGREICYPRRDGRPGHCRAKILRYSNETVVLSLDWDEPHGGRNIQTYKIQHATGDSEQQRNVLLVENKITLKTPDRANRSQVTSHVKFKRMIR